MNCINSLIRANKKPSGPAAVLGQDFNTLNISSLVHLSSFNSFRLQSLDLDCIVLLFINNNFPSLLFEKLLVNSRDNMSAVS